MKNYVVTKIEQAEPMDEVTFKKLYRGDVERASQGAPGYHAKYPDGYNSWYPKDTFEACSREITDREMALLMLAPVNESQRIPDVDEF